MKRFGFVAALLVAGVAGLGSQTALGGRPAHAAGLAMRSEVKCPGYKHKDEGECHRKHIPPGHTKSIPVPDRNNLHITVTSGSKGATVYVKNFTEKPSGVPAPPASGGKAVTYMSVQVTKGSTSSISFSTPGHGKLYAYNPSTNSWTLVTNGQMTPGVLYAYVPA